MARINHLWIFAHRVLLVSLIAAPAVAQIPCEDDAFGELPDCSFEDATLTNWTLDSGSFFEPAMAAPRTGSGSAEMHAVEAGPDFYTSILSSQCFAVTPAWQSNDGAWMRALESFEPVGCYVTRFAYEDSGCSNLLGSSDTSLVSPHAGGWTESAGTGELTGEFARLEINCSSTDGFEIQVDDAYSVRPPSCLDDPNNVVPNCSLEEGDPPSGWRSTGDSFGGSTEPALFGIGSGVVDAIWLFYAVPGFDYHAEVNTCVPLPPGGEVGAFGISLRLLSGSTPSCVPSLFLYEQQDCVGPASLKENGGTLHPTGGGWVSGSSSASGGEAASAGLALVCTGSGDFVFQIDEAFVRIEIPIFDDGFEAGDTSLWVSP